MTDDYDLVAKEGPRGLWQQRGNLLYVATCDDCHIATHPGHRIDAEDFLDLHQCEWMSREH